MDHTDFSDKYRVDVPSEHRRAFALSQLVKNARFHAGLTQAELAQLIGTQQPNIARAEKGEVEPSIELLEKIAVATGGKLILPRIEYELATLT